MRRTGAWVREGGWLWFTVEVLIGALLVMTCDATLTGSRERDVRLLSLVLQAIGFWIVSEGLRDIGHHFGSPGFLKRLRSYWVKRPWKRSHDTVEMSGLSAGVAISQARGGASAAPGATIEQRLKILEQASAAHEAELAQLSKLPASLRADIAREGEKHRRAIAETRGTITATIAQGIGLEGLGVGYFVAGTVLSSFAPEIAGQLDRWF